MVGLQKLAVLLTAALVPMAAALPFGFEDIGKVGSDIGGEIGDMGSEAGDAVSKYIVTLKEGISEADLDTHMRYTRAAHKRSLARRGTTPIRLWGEDGSGGDAAEGVRHSFAMRKHRSYSGRFDARTAEAIRAHEAVASVEVSKKIFLWDVKTQSLAPWGLGSLSVETGGDYPYMSYIYDDSAGEDTYTYIIDTGIHTDHPEFEGRASMGKSFIANETDDDLVGHGTHVAGIVGGRTYGVAKKTQLIGIKVLDAHGNGDNEDVLRALQWVYDDVREHNRSAKSVVNMSLGGAAPDPAGEAAVRALWDEGVLVVTAAGNEDADAKDYTPANSPYALTVGAISANNTRADFSNWGPTVDIWAPGNLIISAGLGEGGDDSKGGFDYMSGTSQAAPHVAGLAVYLRALYPGLDKAEALVQRIKQMGIQGAVGDPKGSANLLAFNGLGKLSDEGKQREAQAQQGQGSQQQ